jgi:hypothetical protein
MIARLQTLDKNVGAVAVDNIKGHAMNPQRTKFALFTWIIGLCLLVSIPLRAQVAGGTLSGTITDPSGSVVPNAAVEIKNSATGITKTITTSTEGYYTAPNPLPGNYEVAVSAPGFNTEIKKGIVINVGSQPVGNAGRNILIGPGISNLDFSVFKNNQIKRISENFNVQFRMEIFNALNHANFAPPGPGDGNTDLFDATGATLAPS